MMPETPDGGFILDEDEIATPIYSRDDDGEVVVRPTLDDDEAADGDVKS